MTPTRVLIVDDDPEVHRLARRMLPRAGLEFRSAYDGEEGLRMAREYSPDLVITDVLMPRMDGWTLVKRLRSGPEFALVPVIFLTSRSSTEDYVRGFRLGADDYLEKSSNFWDLSERVTRALGRRRELEAAVAPGPAPSEQWSAGLRGDVAQIGLASLLTVFELGGRGGVLRVRREEEEGVLYLVGGKVCRADLKGRRGARNREAVYALLGWSEGTFEFSADRLRVADEVEMSTAQLLLEAARRIDERRTGP